MSFLRPLTLLAGGLVLALAACGETPPNDESGTTGGTGATSGAGAVGGVSGSSTGGSSTGGSSAGTGAGTAGTSGSGVGGSLGGQGGTTGAGAGGQSGAGVAGAEPGGTGGTPAAGGSAGSATGGSGQAGAGAGGQSGSGGRGGAGAGGRGGAGGSAGASGGASGRGGNGGSGGTASYNPCPAAPAPCVILPFGDSITDGYGTPGGYRIPLFQRTLTDAKRITFVGSGMNGPTMVGGQPFPQRHEGHSGYTIDTMGTFNGISPLVPTAMGFMPDIVLLMIGTNDLNNNQAIAQAPTRLGNLLDSIFQRDANVLIVVAQIVPGRQDTLNGRVMTYNAAIPGLVSTRVAAGRHIVSVDMYGAFTRDANYKNTLLADDLHPNPAGYQRMADTWYAAIGNLLH